jgi:MFS family permease
MRRVFAIRDFFLLWAGQSTSLLGDQYYNIAGAWLILRLTGDPLALGMVIALGGIARAIFTLIGGAITDRVSPRNVMLLSDFIRLAWIGQTWVAFAVLLVMGILNGYLSILLITGLQRTTPKEMLGRVMSMVLLANLVFMPLSQTIAGAVLRWNIPALFVGAGGLLALCAVYLLLPRIGNLLASQLAGDPAAAGTK